MPVTIHVGGQFVAMNPVYVVMTAPAAGIVSRVFAAEGSVVPAGAPLVTVRNLAGDRQEIAIVRLIDSLAALPS